MTKIHKGLFIASIIIAIIGAYLYISSEDKLTAKSLLIAGIIGQLYHLIAFRMLSKKTTS